MSLFFTREEEAELKANCMRTDGRDEIDPLPVVKLFATNGRAVWLFTELSPFYEGLAFGLCDLGFGEPELGNVYIPEIEVIKHETLGIPLVERDNQFEASHTLSVYAEAARSKREITFSVPELETDRKILERRRPR